MSSKYYCVSSGDPVAIGAPSGLAAFNVHGKTIHAMFKLYPQKRGKKKAYQPLNRDQIKSLKNKHLLLLIIDEV